MSITGRRLQRSAFYWGLCRIWEKCSNSKNWHYLTLSPPLSLSRARCSLFMTHTHTHTQSDYKRGKGLLMKQCVCVRAIIPLSCWSAYQCLKASIALVVWFLTGDREQQERQQRRAQQLYARPPLLLRAGRHLLSFLIKTNALFSRRKTISSSLKKEQQICSWLVL